MTELRGDGLHGAAHGDAAAAVFVVVATTDIIFAVDSIPAIFAVTQEPFIVFAANAFALIGLRSLYFLLVGLMDRFVYLSEGLAFILAFIGVKMLLVDVWHVPIWLSLSVIVARAGRHRRCFRCAPRRKVRPHDAASAPRRRVPADRRLVVVRPPHARRHRGQRGDARPRDV